MRYQLPQRDADARCKIVEHLMSAYHPHHYAITGEELASLGLQVRRDPKIEDLAWEMSPLLQAHIHGRYRISSIISA